MPLPFMERLALAAESEAEAVTVDRRDLLAILKRCREIPGLEALYKLRIAELEAHLDVEREARQEAENRLNVS